MATPQPPNSFVRTISAWLDKVAWNTNTLCRQPGCYEISRPGDDYCLQHACHLCHQAPCRVQFQNEQGFCIPCYRAEVRGRHDGTTPCYPVVEFGV